MRSSIIKSFIGITIVFLMTSCKKDYLNLDPIDRYTYYNFPQNESQINQISAGMYRQLFATVNSHLWIWGDMLSDNTSFRYNPNDRGGIAIEEVDEFVAIADNGTFNGLYQSSFDGITQSNYLLENIENIVFSTDSAKAFRTAEARFFRAWHYFNLVRIYGDMPIITRVVIDPAEGGNPSITFPRRPINEVYEQVIIPDALAAINGLPQSVPSTSRGRLTKPAAQMLLAKVYMTQNRFSDAIPLLQSITGAGFGLNTNYANNFNPATKNGIESILEVQADPILGYSFGFMGSWTPWGTGTNIWPGGSNSRGGLNQPTASLNNAYENGDTRRNVTIGSFNNILFMRKFLYWDAVQRANPCNFVLYRYADALLMLAECLNEQGFPNAQAFTFLNQVRSRASLPAKTENNVVSTLAVNSQAAFRLAIEQERRVELAGEAHRWFDLVRTGRAVEVMTAHGTQEKALKTTVNANGYTNIRTVMAIPFREIQQFGYNQNPGWN